MLIIMDVVKGIGCQSYTSEGMANNTSQKKDSEGNGEVMRDLESHAEAESELQIISCAICQTQGTVAECLKCVLRVCDWCMNPSGNCIECQNPWGGLTTAMEDESTDTDTDAPPQYKTAEKETKSEKLKVCYLVHTY